jgi:hypothetical protein
MEPHTYNTLEIDTPILPLAIADSVVYELGYYLLVKHGIDLGDPNPMVEKLAARAENYYQTNERWRKRVRRNPDFGRGFLHVFMRHWLSAEFKHLLYAGKIPWTFANGEPLC